MIKMEDPSGSGTDSVVSPPANAPKSKLDTLSKDDLIKFAKKQMAAMQKMKSKCADLEKNIEAFQWRSKNSTSNSDDSTLIQELTERMDTLLLEKAECQQSLLLSRKDLEWTKHQAKDDLAALREELDSMKEDHHRHIEILKNSMEESNVKRQEEVDRLQKLLMERVQSDAYEECKQERGDHVALCAARECVEEVHQSKLEDQLQNLQAELRSVQEKSSKKFSELQEGHQRELTLAQQEVENLREELAQRSLRHEEELRALEDDCEMERERLLLLHDELTEQLALKDSYLQDVQEEDEESVRGSGIARMLELSGCSQGASSHGIGDGTEASQLRAALEDLQAQNTMLQDELTLLSNVKSELEAEQERAKEEFQAEKEELEFKIDELQMTKENGTVEPLQVSAMMNVDPVQILDHSRSESQREFQPRAAADNKECPSQSCSELVQLASNPENYKSLLSPENPSKHNQETRELEGLRAQLEALTIERDSVLTEYFHTKDILLRLETQLGQSTTDFVHQHKAMKEQGAKTIKDLQDKIEELSQEKSRLVEFVTEITEEKTTLKKTIQNFELHLGQSLYKKHTNLDPQASVNEQMWLACELKESVKELTKQNEQILCQLHMKEIAAHELNEIFDNLTAERDRLHSLLKMQEDQMDTFNAERAKDIQRLQDEKANEVGRVSRDMERLKVEKDTEIEQVREEKEQVELSLKEEIRKGEEMVSSFELTVRSLSLDRDNLQDKLKELSSVLSQAQEEGKFLGSKQATLQLEQTANEKHNLEARLHSFTKEAEQSRNTIRNLEESRAEDLKNSTENVLEFQTRIKELKGDQSLLMGRYQEAQWESGIEESNKELQARIEDLKKEKDMLRCNLEEVVRDTEALQKDLEDMKSANERMRGENQKLFVQISMQEDEDKGICDTEKHNIEEERRQLEHQLAERDSLLATLSSEIAALQEIKERGFASSDENLASQLTEKIAMLEKNSKESEERMNKIKAVAVKAKKELDASKKEAASLKEEVESLKVEQDRVSSSMKDVIHAAESYKNLQIDYDRLAEQLDKERETVEAGERQIAELTKRLSALVSQYELQSIEKEDLLAGMETMRNTIKQLDGHSKEAARHINSLEKDLLSERMMKEQKDKELSSITKELEDLTAQLCKQQQQSQQNVRELNQLRKEAQQSSLLDMEMADYERLVKELNSKLSQSEWAVGELKAQICAQEQREGALEHEIEALKSQVDQGEEKASKMKELLVKTKKDLADSKKLEASLMLLQASLKGELEAAQQQLETYKIEACELMAERHHLQEQLRCAAEQQHRTASSLQQRIVGLQQECQMAKAELLSTTGEFESYKVRVHNVLKQQKTKTTAQTERDSINQEREQLSSQVEQLRSRLVDSQQRHQTSATELQQLQNEHDTLLDRHNKILQETVAKEAELRERLLLVQSENAALRSEQHQARTELRTQAENQRQAFREQVRHLQDEHRATVETLQGQLGRLEEQLFALQRHNAASTSPPLLSGSTCIQSTRKFPVSDPQRRNQEHGQAGPGILGLGDLQSMAREEGEGMETTEIETPSPAHSPLPSLEQLLTSPDPKQEPFVWMVEPTKEELSQKLSTATRSMEHMNSLLHETEATNAVLMEQITLLKSEVRRLERNQEREKSVANMEYLKNVLLQFIFLRSGSERQALLPVIHTMLQLSPEEKSKLAAIAQGEEDASGTRGSGWSSYLHSWSGIR